jgi:peptidoglycan-N-acetylglucosamine deacetylase
MVLPLVLTPGVVWAAYAAAGHLATLGCPWRGPRTSRRVALTFDDGPDPEFTPQVLDLLDGAGAPGTFFLVGMRAVRSAAVVRDMAVRGHEVANHGWSHTNLWRCGPRRTDSEVRRSHELLSDLTGRPPRLFRPAWGAVNAALFLALRRVNARCVFWSIQPEGLRRVAAPLQVERVLRRAHSGAIVDLHDAEGTRGAPARLLEALPAMIAGLRERGYRFATVSDLLAG